MAEEMKMEFAVLPAAVSEEERQQAREIRQEQRAERKKERKEELEKIKERAREKVEKVQDNRVVRILTNITTVAVLAGMVIFAVIGWRRGIFNSPQSLQAWMAGFGIAAPLIFIALQALEVGIPVIPGGVTLLCGVLMFGPWWGFWYNYIGIAIGSMAVFAISHRYGKPLMHRLFSPESIEKYEHWTDDRGRFAKLFAAAIFLPGAPDGLICYLAGTTKMTWKTYSLIILLGKPMSIALYSLGLFSFTKGVAAIGSGVECILRVL